MAFTSTEWIPLRLDLHEDPAVLEMSEALDCRAEHVVGYCHRFWGWCSKNSTDGRFKGFSIAKLGEILSLPGFPELLVQVGWLEYDEAAKSFSIPHYDRWLGQSAKRRLQERERKRKQCGSNAESLRKKSGTKARNSAHSHKNKKDISKDISFIEAGGTATSDSAAARGAPADAATRRKKPAARGGDCSVEPAEEARMRKILEARAAGDHDRVAELLAED